MVVGIFKRCCEPTQKTSFLTEVSLIKNAKKRSFSKKMATTILLNCSWAMSRISIFPFEINSRGQRWHHSFERTPHDKSAKHNTHSRIRPFLDNIQERKKICVNFYFPWNWRKLVRNVHLQRDDFTKNSSQLTMWKLRKFTYSHSFLANISWK